MKEPVFENACVVVEGEGSRFWYVLYIDGKAPIRPKKTWFNPDLARRSGNAEALRRGAKIAKGV